MICMFIMGTNMIAGVSKLSESDSWIALILGFIVALPINLIYAKIHSDYPDKSLLDIIEQFLGKKIGTIINIFILCYILFTGIIIFKVISIFMMTVGLDKTPEMVITLLIVGVAIITLKDGMKPFARWCEFFLYILLPLLIMVGALLFKLIDFDRYLPILFNDIDQVYKDMTTNIGYPFTQTMIFMIILNLENKKSYFKVYGVGLSIAALVLLVFTFLNIGILRQGELSNSYYPIYAIMRRLNFGELIQRVEMIIIIIFIVFSFVKLMVYLFATTITIKHIFKLPDHKFIAVPLVFLISILSYLAYDSSLNQAKLLTTIPYYFLGFQVVLILFIFIISEYKKNKSGIIKQN